VGCKDAVSPSESSAISISVKVAGVYPSDRFRIQVDANPEQTLLTTAGSLVVRALHAGTHTVAILGLPPDCRNDGSNPVSVETSSGNLSAVEFRVSCFASTGAIAVAVSVSGQTRPLWLQAVVDSGIWDVDIRVNATTVLGNAFTAGTHVVKLVGIPGYCEPAGELGAIVDVKTGALKRDTVLARFDIECKPPQLGNDTLASIAFERDGYIMVTRESGGAAVALAEGERPAWSPDGKLIAFQRMRCELVCEHDLWLMTPDGADQRAVIADENFDDFDPALSPSATSIAFMRVWLGPDQFYLAVSDLHGGSTKILSIWNAVGTPSWSPGGALMVFVCGGVPWQGNTDLCLADTNKTCDSYLPGKCDLPTTQLTAGPGDDSDPAWSHDGQRVAFTLGCSFNACPSGITTAEPYIAVIDMTTREVTRLTAGHDPAWSPDGSQLVFTGNASSPGLMVYSFASGSVRRLTDNARDRAPSWRE
jgi:Tol biopolymer transport system component